MEKFLCVIYSLLDHKQIEVDGLTRFTEKSRSETGWKGQSRVSGGLYGKGDHSMALE